MATDPTSDPANGVELGAQPQPVQPALRLQLGSFDTGSYGRWPQINPLVPPSCRPRYPKLLEGASMLGKSVWQCLERRRGLLGGDQAAIEQEALAALNGNETDDLRGLSWSKNFGSKKARLGNVRYR